MTGQIIAVLTVGFLGLIYFLYPRIEEKYFKRPKLILEIKPNEGITSSQTNLGATTKNRTDGVPVFPNEIWYLYEFEWRFNLILRNNSEVNAYDIKLLQNKNQPTMDFKEQINFDKALLAHQEITLPFRANTVVEIQGKDREEHFSNTPKAFQDLMISFEYKNPNDRIFHSRYYFNTNKISFDRISKVLLNEYWVAQE